VQRFCRADISVTHANIPCHVQISVNADIVAGVKNAAFYQSKDEQIYRKQWEAFGE